MKHSRLMGIIGLSVSIAMFATGCIGMQQAPAEVNVDAGDVADETVIINPSAEEKVDYKVTRTGFVFFQNSLDRYEYYGYVEVENTGNCDLYLSECTYDLEDSGGRLLQTGEFYYSCPSVISPGEKGYFYNGKASNILDENVSVENGLQMKTNPKLTKADGKPAILPVDDVSIRDDDYGCVGVLGRVRNNTEKDIPYADVTIILHGYNGEIIGFLDASVSNIAAGSKESFQTSTVFTDSRIELKDIADYKIIAEAMYDSY